MSEFVEEHVVDHRHPAIVHMRKMHSRRTKTVALCIGQHKYEHLSPLPGAKKDAKRLDLAFRAICGDVRTFANMKQVDLQDLAKYFESKGFSRCQCADPVPADTCRCPRNIFCFWSGHGIAVEAGQPMPAGSYFQGVDARAEEGVLVQHLAEQIQTMFPCLRNLAMGFDACRGYAQFDLPAPHVRTRGRTDGVPKIYFLFAANEGQEVHAPGGGVFSRAVVDLISHNIRNMRALINAMSEKMTEIFQQKNFSLTTRHSFAWKTNLEDIQPNGRLPNEHEFDWMEVIRAALVTDTKRTSIPLPRNAFSLGEYLSLHPESGRIEITENLTDSFEPFRLALRLPKSDRYRAWGLFAGGSVSILAGACLGMKAGSLATLTALAWAGCAVLGIAGVAMVGFSFYYFFKSREPGKVMPSSSSLSLWTRFKLFFGFQQPTTILTLEDIQQPG